jgi:predicted anti-sigma-YlaC factor YlaD
MKCKYSKLVSKYFDAELDSDMDKEVFEHLYQCPECRKQIEVLKTVKGFIRRYEPLKADNNFTFRVLDEIENRFAKGWVFIIKPLATKLIPALAMVLVVLSFISFSGLNKDKTVSLEEVLLASNYTSNESIVLSNENLSEYDVFRLTLN